MTVADGWIWFIDWVNRFVHSSLDSWDHWKQGDGRCWNRCLIKTVACSFEYITKRYILFFFNQSFLSKTQPEVISAHSRTLEAREPATKHKRVKPVTCLLIGNWAKRCLWLKKKKQKTLCTRKMRRNTSICRPTGWRGNKSNSRKQSSVSFV